MVGGIVIGVARRQDSTLIHCRESRTGDTASIQVVEKRANDGGAVEIAVGDQVWWQGRHAMWTPSYARTDDPAGCGHRWDIMLPRIGYAH